MAPAFQGDVAVVPNGVPDSFSPNDYPVPYGIWDVTNPSDPTFLGGLNLGFTPYDGELGDKPHLSKAVVGNHFFALYQPSGGDPRVAVVDISDPRSPVIVGDWQDDRDVALGSLTVNEAGTRVYLTGAWPRPWGQSATHFYLYVLDIQNPAQPTEIGRYVFPYRVLNTVASVWRAVPTSDDAIVVFLDGSWATSSGQDAEYCGSLQILDTSDLAAIHELSTFAIPRGAGRMCYAHGHRRGHTGENRLLRVARGRAYEPSTFQIPRIRFRWGRFSPTDFFQTWRSSAPISW